MYLGREGTGLLSVSGDRKFLRGISAGTEQVLRVNLAGTYLIETVLSWSSF